MNLNTNKQMRNIHTVRKHRRRMQREALEKALRQFGRDIGSFVVDNSEVKIEAVGPRGTA